MILLKSENSDKNVFLSLNCSKHRPYKNTQIMFCTFKFYLFFYYEFFTRGLISFLKFTNFFFLSSLPKFLLIFIVPNREEGNFVYDKKKANFFSVTMAIKLRIT